MATGGGLSTEQKRRIEENRQRALLLRSQRNQGNNAKSSSSHAAAGTNNGGNGFSSFSAAASLATNSFGKSSVSGNRTSAPSGSMAMDAHPQSKTSLKNATTVGQQVPASMSASTNPPIGGSLRQGHQQPPSHTNAAVGQSRPITSFYSTKSQTLPGGPGQASSSGKPCGSLSDPKPAFGGGAKPAFGGRGAKPTFGGGARGTFGGGAKPFGGGGKPAFGGGAKLTSGGGQGSAISGSCALLSRNRFVVNIGYHAKLNEIFKEIPSKSYDTSERRWSFALSDYDTLMEAVKSLQPAVEIEPLPKAVCAAFRRQRHGRQGGRTVVEANLNSVDEKLVSSLMTFQREGVNFAISKEGRVLIADDMGLGKTLQAICVACYYRTEWPVLVVSPSSVRYAWAEAFRQWVPSLDPDDINVILNSKNSGTSGQVNIVSYDLMHKKSEELKKFRFQVIIMDECHFLKNVKTARTKAALPLLKAAPRVLLLSGTPALSRPSELYTQIAGVAPRLFPSFHEFAVRYCNATQNAWGWDYSGSSNMAELQLLLTECIMIRRLKQDVLKELPSKTRQMVVMDPSMVKTNSKSLKSVAKEMDSNKSKSAERGILLKYFAETGLVKAPAIRDYVLDLLEAGHKFLIFAHHHAVLDALSDAIKQKYGYIRIDGSTSAQQRQACCDQFQQDDACRVAILSITAANAGLTLTAASMVLFAELFWNPGILVQAEDRVHRIGQENAINIRYLIAKGTADDYIWPLVQKKLTVLGEAGLCKDDFSEADTTALKDPRQQSILSFFEHSFSEDNETLEQEDLACLVAMETEEASGGHALSSTSDDDGSTASGACLESEVPTECQSRERPIHTDCAMAEKACTKAGRRKAKDSVPSVMPSDKAKTLFSGPRPVKKPLSEANNKSLEDSIKAPPSKRPKSDYS